MLTLFVAAPGGESPESVSGLPEEPGAERSTEPARGPIEPEETSGFERSTRPRRRKPGAARRPATTAEPVPAPALVTEPLWEQAGSEAHMQVERELPRELPGVDGPEEELIVHVEDLLAGRASLPRGGFHTLEGGSGWVLGGERVRGWVRKHRLASVVVAVTVALWLIVGISSTLSGKSRDAPRAAGHAFTAPQSEKARPSKGRRVADAARKQARRTRTSASSGHSRQRASGARRVRRLPAGGSAGGDTREGAAVPSSSNTLASTERPTSEQSGGGPFSP